MNDTTHSIRRSASRFFSGTLLSRLSGMLRDVSMAYVFGLQPAIAAFMLAFRLSHLFRRLFGEGALQSAFVPEFENLRHQNSQSAFSFFRNLTQGLTLFLVSLITCCCVALGATLQWGNLSESNIEVVYLTLLMMPSLLFICLFGVNAALLQCEKSYFIPAVAPVAFNVIWIIAVFALQNVEIQTAMPRLAVGVIFACFFQWLLTVPHVLSLLKQNLAGSLNPTKFHLSPELKKMIKPLGLGILGVGATQINVAIDSLFARYADETGPALLWYAIRIQQLPLALFGIALAGAILPPLSRALKSADWGKYKHFLQYALVAATTLMLPLTATIFIMGDSSIQLIYGHGDFDSHAISATTKCLWAYGAGLFPAALVLIMAPACYADRNYHSPAIASIMTMALNFVLNSIFIMYFGWGAISVAIATSFSGWANLIFLGIVLGRKGMLHGTALWGQILKIILITILASVVTYGFRLTVLDLPILSLIPKPFLDQVIDLSALAGVFCGFYGAGVYVSGLVKRNYKLDVA